MKPETNHIVEIPSSSKGKIPASSVIPKKARDAHVFKYLHSASLISLGRLYDDGCTDIIY